MKKYSIILLLIILLCLIATSCSMNTEAGDYKCPHLEEDRFYDIVDIQGNRFNDDYYYRCHDFVSDSLIENIYCRHAEFCSRCREMIEGTIEEHVFGESIENHPYDTPCTICGVIKSAGFIERESSQYAGYRLTVENLTLEEKDNILEWLEYKYKNYSRWWSYIDDNNETKYKIETQNFCDDEFLSLVKDIVCNEDAEFTLERSIYKLGYSGGMTKSQVQYILDNIAVRNAKITIEQRRYVDSDELYYVITIDNLLDLYQRDRVVSLFKEIGIEIGTGTSTIDVDNEGRYENVPKSTILNYYSGGEDYVKVYFRESAGAPHSIYIFELFTETGESRNPYLEKFYDNGNEIFPLDT